MNGSLVDTNVIIKLLSGDENAVRLFNNAENIAVPATVAGELFYGAYKSSRAQENLKLFTDFLSQYAILPVDSEVAKAYGEIKAQLVQKGMPIPENDIWIAATAKAHQLTLLTFDSHFSNIEGLQIQGIENN